MFPIVNVNILFVFPYREYNSSFKKSTLLRNVCVYCITGKVYVLFCFGRRKMLNLRNLLQNRKSVLRDALGEEVKKCVYSQTQNSWEAGNREWMELRLLIS